MYQKVGKKFNIKIKIIILYGATPKKIFSKYKTGINIVQFDNECTFWECIGDCDRYESIEVDENNYCYTVSALSDTYEVTDEEGNYICEAYGEEEDIIEAIKKAIEK